MEARISKAGFKEPACTLCFHRWGSGGRRKARPGQGCTGQQSNSPNRTVRAPNASKPASAQHRAAARGRRLRPLVQLQLCSQGNVLTWSRSNAVESTGPTE